MPACALRSFAFSQKSRRWRLRFFVKPRTKYFINHRARKNHTFCKRTRFAENLRLLRKSECGRMRSFGCASLRAAPLRMTERARFARNQESLARGKITLLPQRTPFAENLRLLRKSECGRMRSFDCATLRAAPFSGSRGAYAPPRETFALCKSKAYSPEAKRSFLPLLASKNCALLQDDGESKICAKPGITRARQNHTFA